MMSARGPLNADIIMACDDVIVDLVNVDQVNGQTGSTYRWGPHVSGTESLTSGPVCQVWLKEKEKGKGGLGSWAQK